MNTFPKIYEGTDKPFIEAHRGAVRLAPENTIASFNKVLEETDAKLIEIDVQLTKDKKIVVIHDSKVDRTTDGKGYVKDFTLAEIQELDAGSWFNEVFEGEKIPTLMETLEWAKNKIWLSIELKNIIENQDELIKKTVDDILLVGMEEQVQIISFNHRMLEQIRKYSSIIKTSAITPCALVNPPAYLKSFNCDVLNGPGEYLTEELVRDLHASDLLVNGGMVNNLDTWDYLKSLNVDLMCTNIPEEISKYEREKFISIKGGGSAPGI